MSKINMIRVILGGLLAGFLLTIGEFVLNGLILAEQWEAAMKTLNLAPVSGGVIAWTVVIYFIGSIVLVWLYAAIRPRYGAGLKTAIYAGLAVWFFAWFVPTIGYITMGLFPTKPLLIALVWAFFEVPIVSIAGAWLYKEEWN